MSAALTMTAEDAGKMRNNRKITKPLMERKRRARINASLTELKTLLHDVIIRERYNHCKLEKADILELAVKHLTEVNRQQVFAQMPQLSMVDKYKAGYKECVSEVSRYLSGDNGTVDGELRVRILNFLSNRMHGAQSETPSVPVHYPMMQPTNARIPSPMDALQAGIQAQLIEQSRSRLLQVENHTMTRLSSPQTKVMNIENVSPLRIQVPDIKSEPISPAANLIAHPEHIQKVSQSQECALSIVSPPEIYDPLARAQTIECVKNEMYIGKIREKKMRQRNVWRPW